MIKGNRKVRARRRREGRERGGGRGNEIMVKSVLNQKYIEILKEIKICASIIILSLLRFVG